MKKNSFFTLLLFSSVLMSCRPMIYAVFLQGRTVVDKATLMVNHTEGREVILIPMMHTGRPAYYQKVKNYLDTLRHRGYVVYYEGIGTVDPPDASGQFTTEIRHHTTQIQKSNRYASDRL